MQPKQERDAPPALHACMHSHAAKIGKGAPTLRHACTHSHAAKAQRGGWRCAQAGAGPGEGAGCGGGCARGGGPGVPRAGGAAAAIPGVPGHEGGRGCRPGGSPARGADAAPCACALHSRRPQACCISLWAAGQLPLCCSHRLLTHTSHSLLLIKVCRACVPRAWSIVRTLCLLQVARSASRVSTRRRAAGSRRQCRGPMRWKQPGCAIQRGFRGQPPVAQCPTLCRHQKIAALHQCREPYDSLSMLDSYDISILDTSVYITYMAKYAPMTHAL